MITYCYIPLRYVPMHRVTQAKKIPEMKDFQLFNQKRIIELYENEHQRELKRARALQRAAEVTRGGRS